MFPEKLYSKTTRELEPRENNFLTVLSKTHTAFGINAHLRVNKIKVPSRADENPTIIITFRK